MSHYTRLEQAVISALTSQNTTDRNGRFIGRTVHRDNGAGYFVFEGGTSGATLRTFQSLADMAAFYRPLVKAIGLALDTVLT